ncbi:MAG: glycosyltransferase family 2 protein [Thermoleophilia bacterium]|nr:glycosyltransferase family 2 protein [Thermoleophilia bacterium]MDH3724174.1 glycosyltransferase family 2 protein [Thermoleophilia bacterium]
MEHLTPQRRPAPGAHVHAAEARGDSVALVIPAYDEEANLPRLFRQIEEAFRRTGVTGPVIIVDDGSCDATASLVRNYRGPLRLDLVRHRANLGLGRALRTGLRRAIAYPKVEWVVTLEGDTTSDLGALGRILRAAQEGADVVQASNHHPRGTLLGAPLLRRLSSRSVSQLMRLASGLDLHTFTNLYRCIRADLLASAFARHGDGLVSSAGFSGVTELLIRLGRGGARVVEVPVVLDAGRRSGESNMRVIPTTFGHLRIAAHAAHARVVAAR